MASLIRCAHRFLRELHAHRKLKRCYTQNIDSLEAAAGLPKEMVVAAHGNFDEAHVVGTGQPVDVELLKQAIFEGEASLHALCRRAGGLVKPAITFFGEPLPQRFHQCAHSCFEDCLRLHADCASISARIAASRTTFDSMLSVSDCMLSASECADCV